MARTRLLHPEQTIDEDVNALSIHARYVWAFLPCHADRDGRLVDKPFALKLQILPVEPVDMDGLLAEIAEKGFIVRYQVDGKRYIAIRTFPRHQHPHRNEAESVVPPPPLSGNVASTPVQGQAPSGNVASPSVLGPSRDGPSASRPKDRGSRNYPSASIHGPSCTGGSRGDPVSEISPPDPTEQRTEHAPPPAVLAAPRPVAPPAGNENGITDPLPSKLSAYDLTQRFGIAWRERYRQPWAPDREASAAARDLLENMIGRMTDPEDRAAALEDVMPALARYLADTSPSLLKNRHPFPWFVDRFNQYRVAEGAAAQQVFTRPPAV